MRVKSWCSRTVLNPRWLLALIPMFPLVVLLTLLEVVKAAIDVLDALLDSWLGRPLDRLNRWTFKEVN